MRSFRVGSVFGIPIKLDVTFLLILPVFAWLIGNQVPYWVEQLNLAGANLDAAALTGGNVPLLLGSLAAVGLFTAVVLHELGHSVVAMRYGFPIDSITLWILGGVAQLSEQPEEWKQEFFIALAGPAVSVALAVISYAALVVLPASMDVARFVFGYLALMNVALAAFNLLPGFPMDGGRVLRALLARNRPFARATQIAAEVGKLFALLLGLFGLFVFNLILMAIAFFIYVGASTEAQRTVMNAAFQNVQVRDIMTPAADVKTVNADDTVAALVEQMFRERHTGYPVLRDGRLVGMVTLDDAREVADVEREAFTVEDVMSADLRTIPAGSNAMDAFEAMQQHGIGRLLVTDGPVAPDATPDRERLVGLISRTDLMTALDVIQNSGSRAPTTGSPAREAIRR